jgi:carboxypeptidase Q
MKRHGLRVLGLAVTLLLPGVGELWAERGPSTPKERAKALRLVRELEMDPFGEKATDSRRWLALWQLDVTDLQVRYCVEVLGGTTAAQRKVRPELLAQIPWSGAAYLIENPGKAGGVRGEAVQGAAKAEVYLAGVEGALRAYEAMLRARPDLRAPLLDDLLAKREAGELAAYVAETSNACP